MKLEEIAYVITGIVLNRERAVDGENSYTLFSLKDYEENSAYETLITNKDLKEKLSQKGDLLFRILSPNRIIYVDESLENMLISSHFFIIRLNSDVLNPIVLKWYLESQEVKEILNLQITGSIMQSMPISAIKNLEIPDIIKENQNKMKTLIELWEKEKNISKQILEKKEKLYNHYLEELIKRGENCEGEEL